MSWSGVAAIFIACATLFGCLAVEPDGTVVTIIFIGIYKLLSPMVKDICK